MDMDARTTTLMGLVVTGSTSRFTPVNSAETTIVKNADNLRNLNEWSRGRAFDIIQSTASWTAKQEFLRFLSQLDKTDWEKGVDLVQWCTTAEIGFDMGVLTRVLTKSKTEDLPIEWIAASEMDEKKYRFDDNGNELNAPTTRNRPVNPQPKFNAEAILSQLRTR